MSRIITDAEKFEILSLKPEDITKKKLAELFAATRAGDARFKPTDRFTLHANTKDVYNKTTIETTIGKYLFNMFTLPKEYLKKYGYNNGEMNGGGLGDFSSRAGEMIASKTMATESYIDFLRKGEWLAGTTVPYIAASYHWGSVANIKEVDIMKENLTKEYADKIAEGDVNTLSMIDNELVKEATRIMEKNPDKYRTIDWAKAGVYKIGNNYKKTNIATGLQRRPGDENEYFYVGSNYASGLEKKDFAKNSNLAIGGGLSRGLDSAESGYSGKKISGAMSTWNVDQNIVDCGTKHTLDIVIEKGYDQFYHYRNIVENGSIKQLTPDNIKSYVGKKVHMRSPMYCTTEDVCKTCAGDFLDRLGIEYQGLAAFEIADVLVNQSMKLFHDSSIKTKNLDPNDYITKVE